jgi:hypothetical protein
MAGMVLLPTTLIASMVTFVLTSEVGLIHSQRERDVVGDGDPGDPGDTDARGGPGAPPAS